MLIGIRRTAAFLLPLTGMVLFLVNGGFALEAGKDGGENSGLSSEGSMFKKEVDQIIFYLKKELPTLLEKENIKLELEWIKLIRHGLGEAIFEISINEGRWQFNGFPEKIPSLMLGEPPEVFKSLKTLKIFGFDAIKVTLVKIHDGCFNQEYELSFPRILVEFSDGTPTREIVLNPFYVTNVRYCNDEWDPGFETVFYSFISWMSCESFGTDSTGDELKEFLSQISWFVAHQNDMGGGDYVDYNKWCTFVRKQLE